MSPGDFWVAVLATMAAMSLASTCAWWISRRAGHKPPPDDGQGIKFN